MTLGSVPYKYYAQVGNNYVLMSDTGEVRVSKNVATDTNSISDTPYFTGKVIDYSSDYYGLTGLNNLVQVNGLLVALAWGGEIYTSYNGIEWTRHETLSYDHEDLFNSLYNMTVSIGHNSNKIVLGQQNGSLLIMNVPYNAISEDKVTPYPQADYVAPGDNPINITTAGVYASVNTDVDPNASS